MSAAQALTFASSHSTRPITLIRRLFSGIRRHLPITTRRQGYLELAQGYERMASLRAGAGDERGARYYAGHATAIRETVAKD